MRRRRPPAVFSLEGVTGSQREYIEWMLATCAADRAKVDAILDPAAVDLLASRLRTPLQIEQHLTLALETGYQASEKPVGEAIVDSVLSKSTPYCPSRSMTWSRR